MHVMLDLLVLHLSKIHRIFQMEYVYLEQGIFFSLGHICLPTFL